MTLNFIQKNTFNMRQISLMNLAASQLGMKNGTKSLIPNLRRAYSITSPTKSLDILRKNLQDAINKDIDNVLKKYVDVSSSVHKIWASFLYFYSCFEQFYYKSMQCC